jgi:hypothetical protein
MIYGLLDPRDGHLRYVGMSVDPWRRLRDHVLERARLARGAPAPKSDRVRWLASLVEVGLAPQLLVLEAPAPALVERAERRGRKMGR